MDGAAVCEWHKKSLAKQTPPGLPQLCSLDCSSESHCRQPGRQDTYGSSSWLSALQSGTGRILGCDAPSWEATHSQISFARFWSPKSIVVQRRRPVTALLTYWLGRRIEAFKA